MDDLDSQHAARSQPAEATAVSVRELDPAWLRDNCQCSDCRDPVSGQRFVSITDQPDGVILASVTDTADGWYVRFEPDGHQAVVTRAWLASQLTPAADGRTEDAKQLWTAAGFPAGPPAVSWADYLGSDATRLDCLRQLWTAAGFPAGPPAVSWADYLGSDATRLDCLRQLLSAGLMLLRGAPAEPGTVLTVAATMGYVRETNYGRLFDVRVEATPANLAFTGLPIGPHTDNPYRDPVPTLQLLHCLISAADGGESGLLDGFCAAGMLRAEDPAAFDCLTRTPVTFGYRDQTSELRATRPMIGVDMSGRIREVRYNSRSMQPMRPAAGDAPGQAALQMREFYRAYRAFATTLLRPDLTLRFSLEPGDCVVFDNMRVLHSRTGFTATGHRHLQGCYADIDGVESTVAVLARRVAAMPDTGVPDTGMPDTGVPGGS